MHIFLLDNYDSFTYNLVHALERIDGLQVSVFRNDAVDLDRVAEYDKIVLSPGPGLPEESGCMLELIRRYAGKKPILGVCLGHQAIVQAMGGFLVNLPKVLHGISTPMKVIQEDVLFKGMPSVLQIGRYHSWVADSQNFPETLEITATDEAGEVMAFRHKTWDLRGVQFHPESVLTPQGPSLIENWVRA